MITKVEVEWMDWYMEAVWGKYGVNTYWAQKRKSNDRDNNTGKVGQFTITRQDNAETSFWKVGSGRSDI